METSVEYDIAKLGGIGASDCGKLFTKAGLKAKTAQTLAFDKACEIINGYRKNFTTVAMQHGLFNEEEAYLNVVKPFYPHSKYQSSESIWINENCWVTPDVIDDVLEVTIDIKCPYTPYTYWNNIKKLPDTYISQNQMQMIGTGHKKGAILVYLTSNNIDEWGNKIEYDIPISKRHFFIPIEPQKDYQDEILKRIDEFLPIRDKIIHDLSKAKDISDIDFFELCGTKKVTRFKDKHNLLTWENKIIKNNNEYYTVE